MIETIDLINQFIQLVCVAAAAILAVRCALLRREEWLFHLLAGAFGCYFLGDMFYTLHLLIAGDFPAGFSAADLSYLGAYCFLLSINLGLMGEWTNEQKETAQKYRCVSFAAPAVVILLHIVYAYLAGNPINNALFCVPLAFLSYYSLLLFLMDGGKGREARPSLRQYHGSVLVFLLVENMMFLTSSFGLVAPFIIFDFMMNATVLLMFHAMRRGTTA